MVAQVLICFVPGCLPFRRSPNTETKSDPLQLQRDSIPADTAIALSVIKRARELLVGVSGLLAWQWSELRQPGAQV